MLKRLFFLIFFVVATIAVLYGRSFSVENAEPNPKITEKGWGFQAQFEKLPSYIRVYKTPLLFQSQRIVAYIAVADMSKATFVVLGDKKGSKTLSQFYNENKIPIVMNGGYFWKNTSLSLICKNKKIICPNSRTSSKDWLTMYYPTRGVFGLMENNSYQASWVYTTTDSITYSYPVVAKNDYKKPPKAMPSDSFPKGGIELKGKTLIGGGPVLIKNGTIRNTYKEELLNIGADSNQPRSAIGITDDKKLIFFVCEGRNMTKDVLGLTTHKVALIMSELGCVDAMNLDGGGSSCLLVNGKETIKSSDGEQRAIVTAIGLK